MSFKIVPWLLVLSITFAYAFPAAQHDDEDDPNHVHDEHCSHPIKDAYNKVKTSVASAYQKTKQTIGNAFNSLKNTFKKPEAEKKADGAQGNEGTESVGGDNSGRNDGSSLGGSGNTGGLPDANNGANNGGSFGVSGNNPSGTSNVGNNPSATSNVGNNAGTDQQRPPTDSEVEQLINVRFKPYSPNKF